MRGGLYEIFTAFFFILVMLGALFFWLSVSGTVTLLQVQTGEERLGIVAAREAHADIINCNEGAVLAPDRFEECLAKEWDFIKAIKVEQEAYGECSAQSWGVAAYDRALEDTSVSAYPYWVVIDRGGDVCLARMVMAV